MTTRSRAVHINEVEIFDSHLPFKSPMFDWSFDHIVNDDLAAYVANCVRHVHQLDRQQKAPDFEQLRPYFAFAPANVVEKTFGATTQYGRHVNLNTYRQHFKTRNVALSTPRRHEAVATDTVFADTPAFGSGAKAAQLFVGHQSLVTDVLPARNGRDFASNLMDNIRKRGAIEQANQRPCSRGNQPSSPRDSTHPSHR